MEWYRVLIAMRAIKSAHLQIISNYNEEFFTDGNEYVISFSVNKIAYVMIDTVDSYSDALFASRSHAYFLKSFVSIFKTLLEYNRITTMIDEINIDNETILALDDKINCRDAIIDLTDCIYSECIRIYNLMYHNTNSYCSTNFDIIKLPMSL